MLLVIIGHDGPEWPKAAAVSDGGSPELNAFTRRLGRNTDRGTIHRRQRGPRVVVDMNGEAEVRAFVSGDPPVKRSVLEPFEVKPFVTSTRRVTSRNDL